jgi:hypothetical protein
MNDCNALAALIGFLCGGFTMAALIYGPRRKRKPTAEQIRIAGEPHYLKWNAGNPCRATLIFKNRQQAEEHGLKIREACRTLQMPIDYIHCTPIEFEKR